MAIIKELTSLPRAGRGDSGWKSSLDLRKWSGQPDELPR